MHNWFIKLLGIRSEREIKEIIDKACKGSEIFEAEDFLKNLTVTEDFNPDVKLSELPVHLKNLLIKIIYTRKVSGFDYTNDYLVTST